MSLRTDAPHPPTDCPVVGETYGLWSAWSATCGYTERTRQVTRCTASVSTSHAPTSKGYSESQCSVQCSTAPEQDFASSTPCPICACACLICCVTHAHTFFCRLCAIALIAAVHAKCRCMCCAALCAGIQLCGPGWRPVHLCWDDVCGLTGLKCIILFLFDWNRGNCRHCRCVGHTYIHTYIRYFDAPMHQCLMSVVFVQSSAFV